MKKETEKAMFRLGLWFGMKAAVMLALALYARKLRKEELKLREVPEEWLKKQLRPIVEEELG